MKTRRGYTSLRIKSFKLILLASLILVILGSSVGLLLHIYTSIRNFKTEADNLIDYMMSLEDMEYIDKLFSETKEIYYDLPEELRPMDKELSEEYQSRFRPLVDDDYLAAKEIMTKCQKETDRWNLWLVFIDPERGACVYVLDADSTDNTYPPGFWLDGYDLNLIEKICDSGWRLEIMQFDKNGYVAGDYKRIYSPDGEVIGYVEMDLELTEFAKRINRFLMILIPSIIFLVLIIAMLLSRMLKNFVITHLTELADAAKEYTARDNTAIEEATPSVFEPLAINTADEIEDLWLSMTGMETDVKESMLRLREMTSEKERMLAELDIAKEIQMGTLPADYPERCEFGLYASIQPAKSVGGDLYDFFMVDDDHLVMVIADVSGKGVSAALFMVIAKTMIQNQTELGGQDPAEVFYAVNTKLMRINKAHMFVTAWLGILTISTGELIYVNAGHEYPAVRRCGEDFKVVKDVHCIPLAASKRAKFESGTFMLYPGDTIYVYTDGVPEANNEAGEMLGRDRMLEALNREPDADPETIDRNVHEAIAGFIGDADQFDDTTMLCLKYVGRQ